MEEVSQDQVVTLYTIGHGVAGTPDLIRILAVNLIDTILDVRSIPYSRIAPQFNKAVLELNLREAGIAYRYAGKHLGGYPEGLPSGPKTARDYEKLRSRPEYQAGIKRIIEIARTNRAALFCAEENPYRCHRHLLITPDLIGRGIRVIHLRHDGTRQPVITHAPEPSLFDNP